MAVFLRRFAAVISVFILLQECSHVHMANVHHGKHSKGIDSKPNEDELIPQKVVHQTSSRRGWISSVFKVIKFGGKVASTTTSLAGLGNAIFRAIAGCCTDFPDACQFRDEFNEMKAQIKEKSGRADQIELQAQNIQVFTNYTINAFEDILDELNDIANEQETFLKSISPEVTIALNNQTAIVKRIIKEKTEKGQEVEFTEISSMYESALDNALSIGFPLVGLVIPVAKNIYGFAKKRMSASSTAKVEVDSNVKMVDPPPKSRLGRYIAAGKQRYQNKVNAIKVKLNQRFGKAVKIGTAIGKGFKVAMSYFNAGINIYMIIQSHESCKTRRDEARKARDELKKAIVYFDDTIKNLTEAKGVMEQSFQYLRGNVTHDSTIQVVENIKTMVEDISAPSEDLVEVAVDIQDFLDNIKEDTSLEGTYRLEQKLHSALRKIPFTLRCYTSKMSMMNYIVTSCKGGKGSFDNLFEEAKGYFDHDDESNPDSTQNCARKTGYRFIIKEDLLTAWKEIAKNENVYEICTLNDPAKKEMACSLKKDGYDVAVIAQRMKVPQESVQSLVESCPEATELTPAEKSQVCGLRAVLSDEIIASSLSLDLNLVKKVTC